VKLPTGGRKKKLKARVAAMESMEASIKPQVLATARTSSRYANPTVVALIGINLCAANVIAAKPASDNSTRTKRDFKDSHDLRGIL